MSTRRVTATAVVALALILAGCEDGPTLPEIAGETSGIEAQAAAALEQGAAEAQVVMESRLTDMPVGTLPAGRRGARPDSARQRPDSLRERPDGERRRPDRGHERRAELAIALATESLELSERLLEGSDPSEEQLRHLEHATALLRRAEEALEAGRAVAALELAEASQIAALTAVVLPRGISDDEARAIHDLAKDLLRQAHEAVGDDAGEIEQHLLRLATALYESGERQLQNGSLRGVVALWKSAAISSFLIG
jgi:hypothetical protein